MVYANFWMSKPCGPWLVDVADSPRPAAKAPGVFLWALDQPPAALIRPHEPPEFIKRVDSWRYAVAQTLHEIRVAHCVHP